MKIMLTYVGGIAGQSVIKMIRRSKYNDIMIIGLDSDKNAVGLKWCDLSEVVPSADYFYDLGYQSEYRKIIEREKPDLILPTGEEDLEFLSQFKSSFMNTKSMIQLCQDKYLFYKHFKKDYEDFLPKTSDSPMDFDSLPIIIKPMIGRGSRGFRLIKDFSELAAVQKFGEHMYQEYLPGQEWTIDCVITKEKSVIIPRKRVNIKGGNSTCGTIEMNKTIIDFLSEFLKPFVGPLCVQMIEDKDGNPKLTEINPRFGGGSIFAELAGVNLVDVILDQIHGEDNDYKAKEITVTRFWDEIIL